MTFVLPALPFASDALGPHMSAETLAYHHGKHHRAYVDKVNGWIDDKKLAGKSLVEVIRMAYANGDRALFSNAAQIWNHSFFWLGLSPSGGAPTGRLQRLIDDAFGSTAKLIEALAAESVGHFASGWSWLVLRDGNLAVTSLHDADTPVVHEGMMPLLTLDLWEHAYYVDYRNARPKYAEAVLTNLINWNFVAENLDGGGLGRADQQQVAELA